MAQNSEQSLLILQRLLADGDAEALRERHRPRLPEEQPLPPRFRHSAAKTPEAIEARRTILREQGIAIDQLCGSDDRMDPETLEGNIENYVGLAQVPVGIVGPLRVNGAFASGDFYVPMATTEGALVASYQRGAQVVNQAGGCTASCLTESVIRSPCFVFDRAATAGAFLAQVLQQIDELKQAVESTSRHCRLLNLRPSLLGKELYLILEFFPGDASGQNMVTLATEAVCRTILERNSVTPTRWYIEGNLSGDKKATMLAFLSARGKKTIAECVLPEPLVRRYLHTTPEAMFRYWQISVLGGIQSGSIGVHGHYANALAAIFIACGQDVACVAEASVGATRMDLTDDGELYVSVTLPNVICGTVGGGTHLPTARECLQMLGCVGEGTAPKLAEIIAATVLSGEVSIIGSMSAGDFAQAHASYGRKKKS
ncbi:hydroxymethylglutaryl-CoA reductase [Aeoliella mucimassa]|uniref:hydroxymethylglutaryl-CoA reductase (NADPH) n=1 Tax=Aeoliella mucimassa TaxID=2527972 RepID=A0A518AK99_9BACT|nr:hydroxymethylglutaryl-CoA reductase [Aeoliella mucimassa]QDU55104.1 Hydroxymethylglutaryl-coenzyme A reductase [Aeoliella mucimassa]